MAIASWPSSLPRTFKLDSDEEGAADSLLRSQMDVGPAKVRRRTSANVRPLSGTMSMTTEQLAVARSFEKDTLLQGALPFSLPDQIGGAAIVVRFASPPSWKRTAAGRFDFSMSLEVLP